ncbi:MAG: hypothetical protein HQM13_16440 [SAR324 cluster bacterium]|nr:hypothetical protein [SAR324 cluster bacterium]
MKNFLNSLFCLGIFVGVFATSGWAGTIRLQMKASVEMNSELLWAKIDIQNKGNEAAEDIKPSVMVKGRSISIRGAEQLHAGQTLLTEYRTKQHPFHEEGFYYLPMHVEYRDQTGSRFKLPFLVRMVSGEEKPAGLILKTSMAILPRDDTVEVSLTNTDSWTKIIHFNTAMAMDLALELPDDFELKGKETRTWHLKIKHGTLWPNTYFSYLIAEFSHEGQHYAQRTLLKTQMLHESTQNAWLFERPLMATALIILILIAATGAVGPQIYRKLWQKHS